MLLITSGSGLIPFLPIPERLLNTKHLTSMTRESSRSKRRSEERRGIWISEIDCRLNLLGKCLDTNRDHMDHWMGLIGRHMNLDGTMIITLATGAMDRQILATAPTRLLAMIRHVYHGRRYHPEIVKVPRPTYRRDHLMILNAIVGTVITAVRHLCATSGNEIVETSHLLIDTRVPSQSRADFRTVDRIQFLYLLAIVLYTSIKYITDCNKLSFPFVLGTSSELHGPKGHH